MTGQEAHEPAHWELEEVPCDYCGETDAELLLTGRDRLHGLPGEFRVVQCPCGLVRTSPRPTLESLGAAYPDDYGPHQAKRAQIAPPKGLLRWALANFRGYPLGSRSSWAMRMLLAPLAAVVLGRRKARAYLPYEGEGRLLDFGCGAGRNVARLAAAGWQAEGMDLSAEAVRTGREAGLTIHHGTLPGLELPEASYDAVTMWNVVEHVPSPMATLKAVARILKPGGTVLVVVPQFDSWQRRWFGECWYALDLPRHLTHFTRPALWRHLGESGFRVERTFSIRRPGVVRHSFRYLAERSGRWIHRRLARSRLLVGAATYAALLARQTGLMMCMARRTV